MTKVGNVFGVGAKPEETAKGDGAKKKRAYVFDDSKSPRGFAAMDPAKQREISSKGGKSAHEKGTAHEFTAEEARRAGRSGGLTVSRDRAHMSKIGRIGGKSRGRQRSKEIDAEFDAGS